MAEKKKMQMLSTEEKNKIMRSYGFKKEKISSRREERIEKISAKGKEKVEEKGSDNEMIEGLVKHFGEEFREEIEESFRDEIGGETGTFTCDGTDYRYIIDEDTAIKMAEDQVREDLNDDPSMFTQDWLRSFIMITDTDRRIMAGEESDDYVDNVLSEDDIKEKKELGDDATEKDIENAKEEIREEYYDEIYEALEDPIQYFVEDQGIYTREDLLKANFITIDISAATSDAVSTDGWAHWLSRYDENYEEIGNGMVIFREV